MAKTSKLTDKLAEFEIKELRRLDQEKSKKLYEQMKISAFQLSEEMNAFARHQFSYKDRQRALREIRRYSNVLREQLNETMEEGARDYYQFGIDSAEEEIDQFGHDEAVARPSVNKKKVSLEQNDFLINNMTASLETYDASQRAKVSNGLTQALIQGRTGYEVSGKVGKFLKIERFRVLRIVRTEMHKIFNQGKLLSYMDIQDGYYPDLMKRLYHPMDDRTADDSKHLAKLDPAIPLNKPFKYKWAGKTREFMTPPDRPNDRAVLIPFRQKWQEIQEN